MSRVTVSRVPSSPSFSALLNPWLRLVTETDPAAMMARIVDQVRAHFNVERASLYLLPHFLPTLVDGHLWDGQRLVAPHDRPPTLLVRAAVSPAVGVDEPGPRFYTPDEGLTGHCFRTRAPVGRQDLSQLSTDADLGLVGFAKYGGPPSLPTSFLACPIIAPDHADGDVEQPVMGVLKLVGRSECRAFDEHEVSLIHIVAQLIGRALRETAERRRQARRQAIAQSLLDQPAHISLLLDRITQQVGELLRGRFVDLLVRGDLVNWWHGMREGREGGPTPPGAADGWFRLMSSNDPETRRLLDMGRTSIFRATDGDGLTGWVLATGQPLRLDDLTDANERARIAHRLEPVDRLARFGGPDRPLQFLAAPLICRANDRYRGLEGGAIGALRIVGHRQNFSYPPEALDDLVWMTRRAVEALKVNVDQHFRARNALFFDMTMDRAAARMAPTEEMVVASLARAADRVHVTLWLGEDGGCSIFMVSEDDPTRLVLQATSSAHATARLPCSRPASALVGVSSNWMDETEHLVSETLAIDGGAHDSTFELRPGRAGATMTALIRRPAREESPVRVIGLLRVTRAGCRVPFGDVERQAIDSIGWSIGAAQPEGERERGDERISTPLLHLSRLVDQCVRPDEHGPGLDGALSWRRLSATVRTVLTANAGLGFNRAGLLMLDGTGQWLDGTWAIGPAADERDQAWIEAEGRSLSELISTREQESQTPGEHRSTFEAAFDSLRLERRAETLPAAVTRMPTRHQLGFAVRVADGGERTELIDENGCRADIPFALHPRFAQAIGLYDGHVPECLLVPLSFEGIDFGVLYVDLAFLPDRPPTGPQVDSLLALASSLADKLRLIAPVSETGRDAPEQP